MRIVVTGALGHIGSRLVRSLPSSFPGAEIVMIDDLSTQRYASLFDLPAEGRYRFVRGDVLELDLGALFEGADAVVHLAAMTNAEESFQIVDAVERVNQSGTEAVARACLARRAGLIFVSTTSVYGIQAGVVDESCPAVELRPQSPYAASKLRAEELLHSLEPSGLRSTIFRFGTIAGTSPGMRFHTAVNRFCWQAVMGEPLAVWRTALHQKRPYLDLADGVRAIELAIRLGVPPGLFNVLTTNATVDEIVGYVREQVPDAPVEFVDSPVMNQFSYEVDGSRAAAFGFRPQGDLRQAIADTIALLRHANAAGDREPAIDRSSAWSPVRPPRPGTGRRSTRTGQQGSLPADRRLGRREQ